MEISFEDISNEILTGLMKLNPAYARNIGLHEFDGEMPAASKTALEDAATWAKAQLEKLNRFDQASLTEQQRMDAAMMAHNLEAIP